MLRNGSCFRHLIAAGLTGICLAALRSCMQLTSSAGIAIGIARQEAGETCPLRSPAASAEMAKVEALWGMFVGDALSMPVHWYYDPYDIKRDYKGWLKGFVAPNQRHPSSILSISAVGGAGRVGYSTPSNPVIGSVILHDKLKFWTSNKRSTHYHQGMKAGDSTLNSLVSAQVSLSLLGLEPPAFEDGAFGTILAAYVKFMTTPGSHDDTYAESFHREFFRDWQAAGSPVMSEEILEFAEARAKRLMAAHVDHNIDSIGALVMPTAFILHFSKIPRDEAAKLVVRLVTLTHCSSSLSPYVDLYAKTLHAVLNGKRLKEKAQEALESKLLGGPSTFKWAKKYSQAASSYPEGSEERLQVYQEAVSHFGLACYIKGAMTSMFFLAHEFHDDFEAGVLMNTNCGGENCHRGAALGALLGAEAGRSGQKISERWKTGINSAQDVIQDILDAWREPSH